MERCKVLELISSVGDGGAETLVKDYALMIDKEKFDIRILTVYRVDKSSNYRALATNKIKVKSMLPQASALCKFFKHTIGFVYLPYAIKTMIKEYQPNCIHVHLNQLHHLVPIMDELKNIRVIYTCHNTPDKYFSGKAGHMEYEAVKRFINYDNFFLVALHDEMANTLKNMFNFNRISVIRNGINFNRFNIQSTSKEKIRMSLRIPEKAFVIGHVGRFSEQKNHGLIIEIFNTIKKQRLNSYLLLVGSGALENEIREKIRGYSLENSCKILSHRSDIPELMKAMDVFLFPSLYEGLPVTLIEAQVSGLPCVVSDTINSAAIVQPNIKILSLKDSIQTWVDGIFEMSNCICGEATDELKQYDMNTEIKELEKLYLGENI